MRGAALALSFLLAAPLACGSRERASIGAPNAPSDDGSDAGTDAAEEDAGDASADVDADAGAQPGAAAPPAVDPRTAELALERALEPTAIEHAPYGLRFEVVDQGPELPWALVVMNRGTEPVEVTLGVEDTAGERVEIVEGVAGGDTLLTGSSRDVPAGATVRVREAAESPAAGAPAPQEG